jgi:hypothetical protein
MNPNNGRVVVPQDDPAPVLAGIQSMERLQRTKGSSCSLLSNHYYSAPLARIQDHGTLGLSESDRLARNAEVEN